MRRLKAKDISPILWRYIPLIRATVTDEGIRISDQFEYWANSTLERAIERKDIVPILDASAEVRVVVLARMQAFIVSSTTEPERIVARVPRDADDGALIAEALRVLQHRSPSQLGWRLIYGRSK